MTCIERPKAAAFVVERAGYRVYGVGKTLARALTVAARRLPAGVKVDTSGLYVSPGTYRVRPCTAAFAAQVEAAGPLPAKVPRGFGVDGVTCTWAEEDDFFSAVNAAS